jgi:prevent-host-death family protein
MYGYPGYGRSSAMKEIEIEDAKATFSDIVDAAVAGEPAIITRHGKRQAVVISYREYERLSRVPSLGWLIANSPLEDGDLTERKPARSLHESLPEYSSSRRGSPFRR